MKTIVYTFVREGTQYKHRFYLLLCQEKYSDKRFDEFYLDLGSVILLFFFCAGYGLTETSPVTHLDVIPPNPGSIGCVIPNTLCRVSIYMSYFWF